MRCDRAALLALSVFAPTQGESPRWIYAYLPPGAMTSKFTLLAMTQSVDSLEFGAPYSGPQHATLTIRYNPREDTKVFVFIDRGHFVCGPSHRNATSAPAVHPAMFVPQR